MSGTPDGGIKAAKTNKALYGDRFYAEIGKKGGMARGPKGFAVTGKAAEAGRKGGHARLGHKYPKQAWVVDKDSQSIAEYIKQEHSNSLGERFKRRLFK